MGEPPAELIQGSPLAAIAGIGRYRAVYYRRANERRIFALRGRLYDLRN